MNKCPYCGETAITAIRKACLGPGRKVKCMKCGEYISVTKYSMLLYIFAVAIVFVLANNTSGAVAIVLITINAAMFTLAHIKFLPIVKK